MFFVPSLEPTISYQSLGYARNPTRPLHHRPPCENLAQSLVTPTGAWSLGRRTPGTFPMTGWWELARVTSLVPHGPWLGCPPARFPCCLTPQRNPCSPAAGCLRKHRQASKAQSPFLTQDDSKLRPSMTRPQETWPGIWQSPFPACTQQSCPRTAWQAGHLCAGAARWPLGDLRASAFPPVLSLWAAVGITSEPQSLVASVQPRDRHRF